ncbi:hypothetical protein [Serratia liquefaciens]
METIIDALKAMAKASSTGTMDVRGYGGKSRFAQPKTVPDVVQ